MKETIKKVLDRHKDGQGNIGSNSFREMLAVEIEAVLLNETATAEMVDSMRQTPVLICNICGENTENVEYDYIGSGANHLQCELELEQENKNE